MADNDDEKLKALSATFRKDAAKQQALLKMIEGSEAFMLAAVMLGNTEEIEKHRQTILDLTGQSLDNKAAAFARVRDSGL